MRRPPTVFTLLALIALAACNSFQLAWTPPVVPLVVAAPTKFVANVGVENMGRIASPPSRLVLSFNYLSTAERGDLAEDPRKSCQYKDPDGTWVAKNCRNPAVPCVFTRSFDVPALQANGTWGKADITVGESERSACRCVKGACRGEVEISLRDLQGGLVNGPRSRLIARWSAGGTVGDLVISQPR